MKIDLRRFLFVGATSMKGPFLQKAQKAGAIQFIEQAQGENLSAWSKDLIESLKILRHFSPKPTFTDVDPAKGEMIVKEILGIYAHLKKVETDLVNLETQKRELGPFGSFDPSKIKRIEEKGGMHLQFFALKRGEVAPTDFLLIHKGDELDSYMRVGKEKFHLPNGIELSTEKSLKEIEKEIELELKQKSILEHQLEALTAYRDFLHELLIKSLNHDAYHKTLQAGGLESEGKAFSLIGWVPVNEVAKVEQLAEESGVFIQEVALKDGETVPTHLENEGSSRIGQDLIGIYDTPSYADKDPSLWVLCFFTLFFSMIISDAVYGLILLIIALVIRYKAPLMTGLKKRVWQLLTLLSIGCIVWGVLANGYFGIPLDINNPLRKVSIINWLDIKKADYHLEQHDAVYKEWVQKYPAIESAKTGREALELARVEKSEGNYSYPMLDRFSDQIILELALMIGTLHLLLSMGRYATRNWPLFGWILFLLGGYLYVPVHLGYTSIVQFAFGLNKELAGTLGADMMIVGFCLMLVLALIQHRLKGFLEIMTIINILADVLSYLRLYALGLAGGILSLTIFEMSAEMPLFFAIIVIFLGHTVNLGLSIMGGVIHGLRLNFLEWYHYSFEGGGKPFRPLKELQKEK